MLIKVAFSKKLHLLLGFIQTFALLNLTTYNLVLRNYL